MIAKSIDDLGVEDGGYGGKESAEPESYHVVTLDWMKAHRTKTGGWTPRQLDCIGVPWPPPVGWRWRISGKRISTERARWFEEGCK